MQCRAGCGACCIAPSISSPLPGMPGGKPAGVPCGHLTADYHCRIHADPGRPAVCRDFQPSPDVCGRTRREALQRLARLEARSGP